MEHLRILLERREVIRMLKVFLIIILSTLLSSCVTTQLSMILTGKVRPSIDPTEVKIYADPPAQYETIGIIDASREIESSRQKTQDIVLVDLIFKAAEIGANGIILNNTGTESSGGVIIGSAFVASEKITTRVKAIYVIKE